MHWTLAIAKANFRDYGNIYTFFPRSQPIDKCRFSAFNDLREYVKILEESNSYKIEEKSRLALIPIENGFRVMEYPEDGTYWVKGHIIDGSSID